MHSILIVAGEASSALYAQRLLEYWHSQDQKVAAFGIGNQAMVDVGFEALGRSEDLAVVGIQEVIQHWPVIRDAFWLLIEQAKIRRPRCALLLDYPDFNLRLARKLKALGIPVIYYISPQLWAWRKGRVKQVKQFVERMLVVFPFEKDFYQRHGVQVEFVGHPLLDELDRLTWSESVRRQERERCGLHENTVCLGLMPGSRRSEIEHHLEVQIQAAALLVHKIAHLHPVLMVAPSLNMAWLRSRLPRLNFSLSVIQREPFHMIQLADVIVCASGTATLMVGLMEKPMVIMYRMKSLTAWLAKLLVRDAPYFGMVNLIAESQIVPELFQAQASAQRIAEEVERIVNNSDLSAQMITGLRALKAKLGEKGATERVAKVLSGYLL